MIRRKSLPEQQEFWVPREEIRTGKGLSFYERLGEDLEKEGFGDFVRELCEMFYSGEAGGRPPIDPEVYFKMLFVGFFEDIRSERGIASRCEDSISVRRFLRYDITEATPNHSSLSVIRQRLPLEVFQEVFAFSLRPLRRAGLIAGKEVGIDSSITEANASLEKLTSREDGEEPEEVTIRAAADKGYHKNEELACLTEAGIEPVVSCPSGRTVPENNTRHKGAYERNEANRTTEEGKEQLGEKGGESRAKLPAPARLWKSEEDEKISKQTLISAFAFNLSIYSWHVHGFGTAKQFAAGNGNLNAIFWLGK